VTSPVRVCYFGTYDPAFARNALLIAGLRAAGAEVVECRAPLWHDTRDKLQAARGAGVGFAPRLANAWRALARQHRRLGAYDAMIVGYAGHLDVALGRHLARRVGRPVLLDAFLSLADTLEDRGLASRGSLRWRAARLLDRLASRRADRVLVDTRAHAAYFARALGLPAGRLAVVPMGVWPRSPLAPRPPSPRFEVLYFGGYIPLHGLEHVLAAARRLQREGVGFTLVGDGQEYQAIRARARAWGLEHVRFVRDWLPEERLVEEFLAPADVCLGIFGTSGKAGRVLPAKVLLALAAGRAVVTRDSAAAREMLVGGEDALLCAPGDGGALAAALRRLRDDRALQHRLAGAGPRLVATRFGPKPLGARLRGVLADVLSPPRA
jgi:glycosyltransferase involved in cell wall biosynthesis